MPSPRKLLLAAALLLCPLATFALAQTAKPPRDQDTGRVYTDADYAQAEKFMGYNVNPLVFHGVRKGVWLSDDRLGYTDRGPDGVTYLVLDPATKQKRPAFDQPKLAAALAAATGSKVDPKHFTLADWSLADHDQTVIALFHEQRFRCELNVPGKTEGVCAPLSTPNPKDNARTDGPGRISPDGNKEAFIRNWNLWLRELKTGRETQLTTDGVPDFGYATDNAGWKHTDHAILVWSPDSKRIATFQQDQRKTGMMYLTSVTNRHATLDAWRYPLVGDKDVTMIERVVIDLGSNPDKPEHPKTVRLKMPPDQHRSTLCDDISCYDDQWEDVQWSADSQSLAFVSTSRDHRHEWVRIANSRNGDVHDVFDETAAKFFESGNDKVNWHYLSASNELLWFSERSGWGHLYLYDMKTGQLKNQITSGDWNVTQVLGIDEKTRTIFFLGVGKEAGNDPYFPMYYSVGFDGQNLALLTPERADHEITQSPDNRFFLDAYSTPIEPHQTVLRDARGDIVADVAREDIKALKATGWIPLVQMQVKARDNQTDLYGFLFRPTNFSTARRYPIVNYIYPGPQIGSCGGRAFTAAHGDLQSLAELGFIVVCIDGQGTPSRSKAFHEFYAHDLGDNTIPDQVAGMKQLSDRYPWIDLDRVGIYGHSGGGNATAAAMFHFPDFFKVGISESGNHDNRLYEDDWAEKWMGLEVIGPDGKSNYDSQANQNDAKNLKGHLLLAHGTADDNVPPAETLLVVDALEKANKDFDLVLFPNAHHGYGPMSRYMTRRRWDYFVRYLAGATPPFEYKMATPHDRPDNPNGPSDSSMADDLLNGAPDPQ